MQHCQSPVVLSSWIGYSGKADLKGLVVLIVLPIDSIYSCYYRLIWPSDYMSMLTAIHVGTLKQYYQIEHLAPSPH